MGHRFPGRRRISIARTAAVAIIVGVVVVNPAAAAGPTLHAAGLVAGVSGTTVTADVTIAASTAEPAELAGVCARNSAGDVVDFPMKPATITAAGTAFHQTRSLSAGNYTYWACARLAGTWHDIGGRRSFTVGRATAGAPSGQSMPVGDLPGWRQVFAEDFTTPVAVGSFPGAYSATWTAYDGFKDSSGNGAYSRSYISVHDGMLDLYLHTVGGVPRGAAPVPLVDGGAWGGQTYGRFSVRFKSDDLPGYGAGWLLWADSGNWNDGEIDFPEGGLGSYIQAFNHNIGNARVNSLVVKPHVTWTDWHTATIDWKPTSVSFILDGRVIGTDTRNVPSKPLHWVLQTGTSGIPAASLAGHVFIDWVTAYDYVSG